MTIKEILAITLVLGPVYANARVTSLLPPPEPRNEIYNYVPADTVMIVTEEGEEIDPAFFDDMLVDEDITEPDSTVFIPFVTTVLPSYNMRPAVFDKLHILDSLRLTTTPVVTPVPGNPEIGAWINEDALRFDLIKRARQHYIVNNPGQILYNEAYLPEPPKHFTATVDPETARIIISEVLPEMTAKPELEVKFGKKHWLKEFNANLQFSQAFVSPNWYKGGNNNVNALANVYYNVKLNPAFHEKLLFENTFQYKLGMNNAPDDEMRDYSISEDLFQWNMTAGYKSAKRWYYSLSAMFKTQFMNNYEKNSNNMKASFLSPGELNVGLGMTYNYSNPKNTFTFDASISPLSWNMKMCINSKMNETSFGIKEGHKTVHEIGSSAEGKIQWAICENIALRSTLFVFSDYDYIQSDWENNIVFTINRFFTTQLNVHMRYDSSVKQSEDTEWHKFMLKEILSFGFTYKFNT